MFKLAELGQPPAYLFSDIEIPPNPDMLGDMSGVHHWFGLDNEAHYRANPHPRFGPDDVEYRINRHGYRCPELDVATRKAADSVTVACIGSSGLFGAGLPASMVFDALFRQMLEDHLGRPVVNWNLGVGGTGPEYVTRMLFSVIPVLKPDVVLLTTFPFNRREFIGERGRIYTTQAKPHWQHRFTDPERWQMHHCCGQISNPYNHAVSFVTNAKVWESVCDKAGAMWLFTTEGYAEHIESINHLMSEPLKMVGPGIHAMIEKYRAVPETGLARDMRHAGILPNRELAEILFARLLDLYSDRIEQLKSKGNQ